MAKFNPVREINDPDGSQWLLCDGGAYDPDSEIGRMLKSRDWHNLPCDTPTLTALSTEDWPDGEVAMGRYVCSRLPTNNDEANPDAWAYIGKMQVREMPRASA